MAERPGDDAAGIDGGRAIQVPSGTLDSRILFSVARISEMVRPEVVLDVLAWSFNCLANGVWPTTDHTGAAWPAKSDRARRAGQPLTPKGWPGT